MAVLQFKKANKVYNSFNKMKSDLDQGTQEENTKPLSKEIISCSQLLV